MTSVVSGATRASHGDMRRRSKDLLVEESCCQEEPSSDLSDDQGDHEEMCSFDGVAVLVIGVFAPAVEGVGHYRCIEVERHRAGGQQVHEFAGAAELYERRDQ